MSICFNFARRSLLTPLRPTAPIAALPITIATPLPQQRSFAATSNKKKKQQKELTHDERKAALKSIRTQRYQAHLARLERLKTRRDDSPRDVKKTEFRNWYDPELSYHASLLRRAKRENKPWKIRVAVMLERLPVVTPDEPRWEEEYNLLRDYLDTYGREMPGFMNEDTETDHAVQTKEEMIAELPFTPAPRETPHDLSGNVKTLDRRLKQRIYLTIRTDAERNRNGPRWTLPSVHPRPSETLLDAAKRAVEETAGPSLKLWCAGNAPMAVNFRPYGKNMEEGQYYFGEKIFYYSVQYDSGEMDEEDVTLKNGDVLDYAWLTREEIVERVEEERGRDQAKFFRYILAP